VTKLITLRGSSQKEGCVLKAVSLAGVKEPLTMADLDQDYDEDVIAFPDENEELTTMMTEPNDDAVSDKPSVTSEAEATAVLSDNADDSEDEDAASPAVTPEAEEAEAILSDDSEPDLSDVPEVEEPTSSVPASSVRASVRASVPASIPASASVPASEPEELAILTDSEAEEPGAPVAEPALMSDNTDDSDDDSIRHMPAPMPARALARRGSTISIIERTTPSGLPELAVHCYDQAEMFIDHVRGFLQE
jgi:hypothetical protein